MMFKLGVFGGMFDPVHRGHVQAAKFAVRELSLDALKMIPCKTPNHRSSAHASGEHRLKMLQIATAMESKLSPDSIELEREGVSYMVDTLSTLAALNSQTALVLLLGMDSFNSLPTWDRFEKIFELCNVLVLKRGEEELSQESVNKLSSFAIGCKNSGSLFEQPHGRFYVDSTFYHVGSSTEVRSGIQSEAKENDLLHTDVRKYINDHRLYVEANLSKEGCPV